MTEGPQARRRWGLGLDRSEIEDEVAEELRFHLEMKQRALQDRGFEPKDARAEAARRFGSFEDVRDECLTLQLRQERKRMRRIRIVDLLQDAWLSLRTLGRHRTFAVTAVLTLALGIGVTTAIFSVLDAVLLRNLAYSDPDRLVDVWGGDNRTQSEAVFLGMREVEAFADVAAASRQAFTVTGFERPMRVEGARATPNLFDLLGTPPVVGRALTHVDGMEGAPAVAVVSERLAWELFGTASAAVGETLRLEGRPHEIVGVVPAALRFPDAATSIWTARTIEPADSGYHWGNHDLLLVARLADGYGAEEATEMVRLRAERLRQENPVWTPSEEWVASAAVTPLQIRLAGRLQRLLQLLMAASVLVLLVACANVANLLLARSSARQQESAIRSSLGAGRGRLVVSLLIESLVIALLGAGLGIGLALAAQRFLVGFLPEVDARFGELGLDGRMLTFALVLSVVTALVFGLLPAWRQSRAPAQTLLGVARGGGGSGRRHSRVLAVLQTSLATVLLFSAGLTLRNLWSLLQVDLGFEAGAVVAARLDPADADYEDATRRIELYRQVVDRLEQSPTVESAAAVSAAPMGSPIYTAFDVPRLEFDPNALPVALVHDVTEGYFETLRIPLLAGRDVARGDEPGECSQERPCSALVNRELERRLFAGAAGPDSADVGAALGEVLGAYWFGWYRVEGVVADARLLAPDEEPEMALFIPHAQRRGAPMASMELLVRGAGDATSLGALVRETVAAVDSQVPVVGVRSLPGVVRGSLADEELLAILLAMFSVLALVLGCIGIYGVIAYFVDARRAELGVRAALGATPGELRRGVLSQALWLAGLGIAIGGVGCFGAARLVERFLYQQSTLQPELLIAVPMLLMVAALVSAWAPSSRAARLDPATVLRQQ